MATPTAVKLRKAIKATELRSEWYKKLRAANLRSYLGPYYGPDGYAGDGDGKRPARAPINLFAQTVHNLHALLAPDRVRNNVAAKQTGLAQEALKLSMALDHLWGKLQICRDTVSPGIVDALLGPFGIAVVGIKAGGQLLNVNGETFDNGEPFVERVDIDDYGFDASARFWAERLYEYHKYRVPLDLLLESGLYPGKEDAIRKLSKTADEPRGVARSGGDTEHLSKSKRDDRDALIDHVELMDVTLYVGDSPIQITMPADDMGDEQFYLQEGEYQGPPGGRYPILWFNDVPNNCVPLPYVTTFQDLHEAADKIGSKAIRQLLRTKRNFVYNREASDDAAAVIDKPDGEGLGVDDVNSMKNIDFGGITEGFYEAVQWLMGHWNNSAGQVQMLGGGQPKDQSNKTATAAQLMQNNATSRLGKLADRTKGFQRQITEKLAWYLASDPLIETPVTIRMPGGHAYDTAYSAATRRGGYMDFNYDIQPASVENLSPEVRAMRIVELVTKVAPQVLALAQAGAANFTGVMRRLAAEMDLHDLDQFFNDPTLMMAQAQALAPTLQGAQKGMPTPPPSTQPNAGQPTRQAQEAGAAPV